MPAPAHLPPPLPPKKRRRISAWGMAVANLLALPGLGTVMAGRKIGYVQITFSMVGVALTMIGFLGCLANLRASMPPPEDDLAAMANFEKLVPWLLLSGLGGLTFLVGWGTAFLSSRSILHEQAAKQAKK